VKTEDLVLVPLIIGEASGVFAGFCPSWFTVSSPFFHEQDAKEGNVKRIRWGEAAATVIVVATGAALTVQTKSPVPWWISVGICAVFIGGYEYMIAHPATNDTPPGVPAGAGVALGWQRAK
jgi:protein-S-isoprenylcysteine O-methyltransferase Ste14